MEVGDLSPGDTVDVAKHEASLECGETVRGDGF